MTSVFVENKHLVSMGEIHELVTRINRIDGINAVILRQELIGQLRRYAENPQLLENDAAKYARAVV
jgi:two-component sensor histidine kinase